jgi:hypothetical protein
LEIQILKSALRTGGRLIGYYCQFTPSCGLGLKLGATKVKTPKETLLALADSLENTCGLDGEVPYEAAAVIRELVATMSTAQEALKIHIRKGGMSLDYLVGYSHAMECWEDAMKKAAARISNGIDSERLRNHQFDTTNYIGLAASIKPSATVQQTATQPKETHNTKES